MPKPYQPQIISDASEVLARRALKIDWFSSVGKPASLQSNVVWMTNWKDTIASLISEEWDDYLVDARNAVADPIPRPQFDDWNWALESANRVIEPTVPMALRARLKATQSQMDQAVQRVMLVVRYAAIEAHFEQWAEPRLFLKLFTRLEEGRLPCGADGEYPSPVIKIF